ncbi:multidrug resistance protein homolog 49-like [Lutzomyia longipalpis]|uniref:multidrug resistance protein homolog 49-like n=1 Tax=Lutzomyia longipalpis TaxID=7200 RepID=UPI00248446A6|nr:multidrug resistance protein homolog 49-like [Lutzomyia longipalpis]
MKGRENISKEKLTNSGFFDLFRFATGTEKCITAVILVIVFIVSSGFPISAIVYSETISVLINRHDFDNTDLDFLLLPLLGGGKKANNATPEERHEAMREDAMAGFLISTIIMAILVVIITFAIYMMNTIALKQTMRIRRIFLFSVLSKEMSWYDSKNSLDFASKITHNLDLLKDAIGEKLVTTVILLGGFFFSILVCFLHGWKLTLVIGGVYTVLIIVCSIIVGKSESRLTKREIASYSVAGTIAEEVFNAIRTVVAFGGEDKECQRYAESLKSAEKSGVKKSFYSGFQSGIMWFLVFGGFGVAFYYGIHLMVLDLDLPLLERVYDVASVLIIVHCLVNGSQFVTFTIPSVEIIISAMGITSFIYDVINQRSLIDPFSSCGKKLDQFTGNIEFKNVRFHYPSRSDVKILKGVNFVVKKGQTIGLVGSSGSGKSTCLQLIQRLYDPCEGDVLVDGVNIKHLNIAYLRSQIGVVGQEPVLFSTTIAENIRFGNPEATQEDIEKAAKIANCHSFIEKLPEKYDTVLGENGAQLSGGQKQRIAIARAIVRNPKILLLDEATSALDTESERVVQKALDKASEGRTTLTVSHRLSTLRNADYIIVFLQGEIVEHGTQEDLMKLQGHFYNLHMANQGREDEEIVKGDSTVGEIRKLSLKEDESADDDYQRERGLSLKPSRKKAKKGTIRRIMRLSFREWHLMLFGCLCSIVVGSSFPISGILYGMYFEAFDVSSESDKDKIYNVALNATIYSIILAAAAGLAALFEAFSFGTAGVRLTSLLRKWSFSTVIRQEMSWFDDPKNSVGALSARLSTDCANVQGATGSRLAGILQATSSVLIGLLIGLIASWKLALLVALTIPLLLAVAVFDSQYSKSSAAKEKVAMEKASSIAVEAISNIRTVASLGRENEVLKKFIESIDVAAELATKSTKFRGLAYSLNLTMNIFTYGIALLAGGYLMAEGQMHYVEMITVIGSMLYGAWMMGIVLLYAPNVSMAISSAESILNLLDRLPKIRNPQEPKDVDNVTGKVSLKKVKFRYPNRPETQILRGLSLQINQGKTVALVGPSGCGKSTCMQLLLRYYDPDEGKVEVDGVSTQDFALGRLRSHVGLVSQEPVLFDRTIAENIAYGDNSRDVPIEEIIEAAKEARIHSEFVTKLPLGYDTPLGSRGTQLSGGQKQRIAIARALVRKPKILLLDEATSALDTESEKTVQMALEKASENRTCIVIAHRLSSIRNADLICVIDRGQIAEMGTHEELLNSDGLYTKLYQASL